MCAIPHFATYRAISVRYPIKTSTKEFCDTIAASIARYEKYRCWASKKRAQRLSFWVWTPPGGVGVFHAKGWWPKASCPPSKLCLPWVSKRGVRDVPGILPGCPGPLAVFKKFVQKNFVRVFRSLKLRIWTLRIYCFSGSGFRSARQVLCGDVSRLFLDHFLSI